MLVAPDFLGHIASYSRFFTVLEKRSRGDAEMTEADPNQMIKPEFPALTPQQMAVLLDPLHISMIFLSILNIILPTNFCLILRLLLS